MFYSFLHFSTENFRVKFEKRNFKVKLPATYFDALFGFPYNCECLKQEIVWGFWILILDVVSILVLRLCMSIIGRLYILVNYVYMYTLLYTCNRDSLHIYMLSYAAHHKSFSVWQLWWVDIWKKWKDEIDMLWIWNRSCLPRSDSFPPFTTQSLYVLPLLNFSNHKQNIKAWYSLFYALILLGGQFHSAAASKRCRACVFRSMFGVKVTLKAASFKLTLNQINRCCKSVKMKKSKNCNLSSIEKD